MQDGALFKALLNRYVDGRFILGLDGLSRAGKTTIVEDIQKRLIKNEKTVYVFHIDDFIVEHKKRYDTGFEEWHEYYNLQWDVEHLRQQLFVKLRDAKEVTLPFNNSNHDEIIHRTVVIPHDCIVIVEGVFLQRKEWREFFDFVVYLDCPRQTRFERESAKTRQQVEKFKTRYWKAEDHYLNTVFPLSNADMVLSS
ncbi:kinase [Paenibacillus sp. Soil787]|uniref:kinase n=1 Tax=Paenibacillus sp. Soil787 TaxID=1736411 RepID=UPI00070380F4|nr:kinase [Paenibacillus sp. Soil787]KRF20178.1 uridine kinase [Paenibacillus sp. Soil787]